ncbi:hypothetical protein N1851_033497 [Merluccius polli]|uniref:THAP domain-containing protein 1 n=1 Tax=Merluccius polli TaxID=89951 RepID=A0AA47LZC0_MERPO|nr:hypothetical protein N1851_034593 [Merluccius polli]KAK0131720.1 hypothetical protein N1851_033497 [Merluccius polli]
MNLRLFKDARTPCGHRLHGFPKDKATLRQWVLFVRVRRAHFSMTSVTANTKICSAHFKEEDYDEGDARMVSLGLKTKRLAKLIPTIVPSVHMHLSACPATTPRGTKIRAARRKREMATMLIDAAQQETADSVDVNDPLPSTCDTGTQCNLKPRGRSHAVQVNLKPKMVSVGTQTQTSTPLTSPEQTDDENDPSVISDSSWVPGGHMSEDEEEFGIDKFIVCQEELMSLFALCPACCEKSDSSIVQQEGTFIKSRSVHHVATTVSGKTSQCSTVTCRPATSC